MLNFSCIMRCPTSSNRSCIYEIYGESMVEVGVAQARRMAGSGVQAAMALHLTHQRQQEESSGRERALRDTHAYPPVRSKIPRPPSGRQQTPQQQQRPAPSPPAEEEFASKAHAEEEEAMDAGA